MKDSIILLGAIAAIITAVMFTRRPGIQPTEPIVDNVTVEFI